MIYFQRKVFKCSAKNQNNMRVACPMPEKSRYSVQIFVTKPKCPKSCVRNFLNIWDSLEVWSSLRQSCYNHTASFPPAAALRIRIPFQIRSSIRMLPPAQVGNVFINVVLNVVVLYLVILNGVAESFRHVMGTLHKKELSIKKFFSKPSMTFKKDFYEILKEDMNIPVRNI